MLDININDYEIDDIIDVEDWIEAETYDIEVDDVHCFYAKESEENICSISHNSAILTLFSFDDEEMLSCKFGNWWELNPQRARANNSAVIMRHRIREKKFFEFWEKLSNSKSGEPGFYFSNNRDYGVNPCCVTEDTIVAVADGSGTKTMKEIVNGEKDIDVYTTNQKTGKLSIETMECARLIKSNTDVYRVNFSNDTFIEVDSSHKFVMKDGNEKNVLDLQKNDAIESMTMFYSTLFNKKNSQLYRFLSHNGKNKSEHRFIFENITGKIIEDGFIIHHKDYNALNNTLENLELMSIKEHTDFHRKDMLGSKNAVFRIKDREKWLANLRKQSSGLKNAKAKSCSTEQIKSRVTEFISEFSKDNNRIPLIDEIEVYCKENNIPFYFQKKHFRNTNISELLNDIACSLYGKKIKYIVLSDFMLKASEYKNGLIFLDEQCNIWVRKNCESTKEPMLLKWKDRHVSFISKSEQLKYQWHNNKNRMRNFLLESHKNRKEKIKIKQVNIYNDLVTQKGQVVLKKEWKKSCQDKNVSSEISRTSSPFRSWNDLKEFAIDYNHRVKSVEYIGKKNVYSGSVINTHTFFAIGCSVKDRAGNDKFNFVLNRNCEISLRNQQFCNLTEVNVSDIEDQKDLNARVKAAAFIATLQAGYTNFHYLRDIWKKNTERDALIGVGMTGIASGKVLELNLKEAAKIAVEENQRVARIIGINPASRVTTVKPSGSSSLVLGCSSGIHPWFGKYYLRRKQVLKNEPLYTFLKRRHPHMVEDDYFKPTIQAVISIPQKSPGNAITRDESAIQLLERVKRFNLEWIAEGHQEGDNKNNVSATISVKDDEWEEVGKWMWENRRSYNGLAIFPFADHNYKQAPFEEITKSQFDELFSKLKEVNLGDIEELEDTTSVVKEMACAGGACEL